MRAVGVVDPRQQRTRKKQRKERKETRYVKVEVGKTFFRLKANGSTLRTELPGGWGRSPERLECAPAGQSSERLLLILLAGL